MDYTPNTDEDKKSMLLEVGVQDIMDLFKDIPENLILNSPLQIPDQLSEFELIRELEKISKKNSFKKLFKYLNIKSKQEMFGLGLSGF